MPGVDPIMSQSAESSVELLAALQTRANTLLAELKSYHSYLQTRQKYKQVEIRIFRRGLESEVKSLETITRRQTISDADSGVDGGTDEAEEAKRRHALRSSNLLHYEAVWNVAKTCRGVMALGKRMYRTSDLNHSTSPEANKGLKGVLVDIVADNGLEWIKICNLSERRLILEMAKEGWSGYGEDSDSDDEYGEQEVQENNSTAGKLDIVRLAEELRLASRATRIRYQHPQVRFILPRISEGSLKDVDAVIADLRATGAIVDCKDSIPDHPCQLNDLINKFSRLLPSSSPYTPTPTPTLNIDCTILLALISDISHFPADRLVALQSSCFKDRPQNPHHPAITRQITSESHSALLPTHLYPLLAGRRLVTTSLAAKRMREIVNTMGTLSERTRADIILGEGEYRVRPQPGSNAGTAGQEILNSAFERMSLSVHKVPGELKLPIEVVQFDAAASQELHRSSSSSPTITSPSASSNNIPIVTAPFPHTIARRVLACTALSPINASVFLYGWKTGVVTVTSNRAVAVSLEKAVNSALDAVEHDLVAKGVADDKEMNMRLKGEMEDFRGPLIHLVETARSLVGKEKRAKRQDSTEIHNDGVKRDTL